MRGPSRLTRPRMPGPCCRPGCGWCLPGPPRMAVSAGSVGALAWPGAVLVPPVPHLCQVPLLLLPSQAMPPPGSRVVLEGQAAARSSLHPARAQHSEGWGMGGGGVASQPPPGRAARPRRGSAAVTHRCNPTPPRRPSPIPAAPAWPPPSPPLPPYHHHRPENEPAPEPAAPRLGSPTDPGSARLAARSLSGARSPTSRSLHLGASRNRG